jgi:chitinase
MLKASDNLPFPTNEECFDGELPDKELDIQSLLTTNEGTGKMFINIDTPEKMKFMSKVIELVNEEGLNSLDVDTEEKELFREAINKHNKSIYGKGKKALNDATKNFMLTQMFDIIESPENQIEA